MIRTVIKVYGSFAWPPLPGAASVGNPASGIVEFGFAKIDPAKDDQPYVRWIPKGQVPVSVSDKTKNIAAFDNSDRNSLQTAGPGAGFAYLLGEAKPVIAPAPAHLRFRGAVLLEQCHERDGAPDQPMMRWLLARSYWRGGAAMSEVLVGLSGDDSKKNGSSFALALALPTPTALSAAGTDECRAFPFVARYLPLKAKFDPAKPLSVYSLASGAFDEGAPAATLGNLKLHASYLGGFGFCRTDGGNDAVYLPRIAGYANSEMPPPPATEAKEKARRRSRDKLWLSEKSLIAKELLEKLLTANSGIAANVQPVATAIKSATTEPDFSYEDPAGGESRNSIYFAGEANGRDTIIRFRHSVEAIGNFNTKPLRIVSAGGRRQFTYEVPELGDAPIQSNSPVLLFEFTMHYSIEDSAIWDVVKGASSGASIPDLSLTAMCGFKGSTADFSAGGHTAASHGAAMLLEKPAKASTLAREALRRTDGAQPDSILPDIRFDEGTDFRLAYAPALTVTLGLAKGAGFSWEVADRSAGAPLGRLTLWPKRGLAPGGGADAAALLDKEGAAIPVGLLFPGFQLGAAKAVSAQLVHDAAALGRMDHQDYPVSLRIMPGAPGVAIGTRIGGLGFQLAKSALRGEAKTNLPGEFGDNYSVWRFDAGDPLASPTGESRHSLRVRFDATAIDPLAPDTIRGDRSGRPRPLLLPLGPSSPAVAAAGAEVPVLYVIDLRETIGARDDRLLIADVMDLRGDGPAPAADRYVILSERPFSISRFEALPLKQRGSADRAIVASYTSDTRSWTFKQVSEHYHYAFPAQAIGETMDKPRRLEIHDPHVNLDPDDFCPPNAPDVATDEFPVEKRHIIQYRLTPSAEIWIRPSDTEQGFFRPEWATHALFREAGALGIGAALEAFRGEYLFGMPVGVDLTLERGPAGGARVAEVEALVGRPLGAIASTAVDRNISKRWGLITTMIARRPERLEFWMRAPGPSRTFTPARFSEGVNFALRKSAAHRSPLDSPLIDPDKSAGPRIRDYGLAGGALWPLESALFTQRLLEAPHSSAGTIERVALSPLGGDADQRAEFLAGQLAIISETRGGRVQRHRVEIIGRISVFWHRAKHVVIYERTASPTQQFGPKGGMGTRSRRPILRKVSEFIELIQPVRNYPDDPAADAMTAGFLKAVRFNSKVIAVDSAWSDDIPDAGWRIPLWNRHAARQRPSVYPRPDIVTVAASEGPEEQPVIAQEILDPDNLFFFADSVAGHADTDRWVARAGIDFTKMPAPTHAQQQPDSAKRAGRFEGRLPSAPRIPRGHRRFTWQLGPAARKTAINAGRAEEPIFAALETLSFQRATQLRTIEANAERVRIDGVMAAANDFVGGDELARKTDAFRKAAENPDNADAVMASARELVAALDTAVKGRHDKFLDPLKKFAVDAPGTCDKMLGQLTGGIERQKLLILDAVRSWQADAAQRIAKATPKTRKEAVDAALLQLDGAVGPLLTGAAEGMGRIGEGAARAQHAVEDIEADLEEIVAKAQKKLGALKASYDLSKPWSAARVTEIHARLSETRAGILGDIEAATADVRSRLATDLDGLARRLGVEVGTRVNDLLTKATELRALADRQGNAVEEWLATLKAPLARLTLPAGPFDRAREAIGMLPAEQDALKTQALDLLDKATDSAAQAADLLDRLKAGVADSQALADKSVARVQDEVAALRADAAAFLVELKQVIGGLGEDELQTIKDEVVKASNEAARLIDHLADMGKMVDAFVDETAGVADRFLAAIPAQTGAIFDRIEEVEAEVALKLDAIQAKLRPDGEYSLYKLLRSHVLEPALYDSFAILDEVGEPQFAMLQRALDTVGDAIQERIKTFATDAQGKIDELKTGVQDLCGQIGSGLDGVVEDLKTWGDDLENQAAAALAKLNANIGNAAELCRLAGEIGTDAAAARDALEKSWVGASAYADSVFHAAGQIGKGDLAAAPGQLLRLYAAAASAPELPNLDFARERLGYYYDELNKVIDTTPAEAWFGRLGEELKAMGLALPFDKLGDRILPSDLSKFDIGKVFRNFGGLDLSKLFKGVTLPQGAKDAIKLTHAFDKKQARAWVQIDINVPLPGRRALLGVGPFKLDFVDARLAGVLRLEASKDSDTIEQTGRAQLLTDIDAVVSGQSMVCLEKLVIHYEKSSGLKVDFDPRNIKINPSLRFVQETLGKLIPDTVGGLKIIKEQGIPVGVSHDFEMPPISLMAVTSGVSNIAISNHFSLIAYPDFIIADRFCLSRPDLPFLFSIFIIGGTGYITVDVDYRPFSNALMVTVEAAAGGSAALGFAAGPVNGSVFITLSVALSYRKLIGRPGGGLTMACVLLVAGNVDVAGIATVYMGLLLRMNYRENGQIDGVGTLKITIRVSRFFKYTVRRDVTYKLRSGSGGGGSSATLAPAVAIPAPGAPKAALPPEQVAQIKANKILEARS